MAGPRSDATVGMDRRDAVHASVPNVARLYDYLLGGCSL
jgi:hypothetical protein